MSATGTAPDARAARARGFAWLRRATLVPQVLAVMAAVARHAVRPLAWRRPARDEFWRFMDIAGVQSLSAAVVLGTVIGISLLAQALYWLERFGDRGALISVMGTIIVREIAPLLVGLLVIGRGGLIMLGELEAMHRQGHDRALDAMGLDPLLMVIMPRSAALAASIFCLSVVFIFITFIAGYLAGVAAGVATSTPLQFIQRIYASVGEASYVILPVQALLMGLAIGAVCALTAIEPSRDHRRAQEIVPVGFIRCVIAIVAVSAVSSIIL